MTAGELADAMLALSRLAGSGTSLLGAVEFFLKHGAAVKERVPMPELVRRFGFAKWDEKRSLRYRQQLRVSCGQLARWVNDQWPGRTADVVSREDVLLWLKSRPWAPKTRNNYLGDVRALFSWAVRERYAPANPAAEIPMVREAAGEVGTLTLGECQRLLLAARAAGWLLGYVVLGLFCGIRRAEIERLTWDAVDLRGGTVIVAGEKAKTRRRRVVDLPVAAKAWLRLCKREGRITPRKFSERWADFRAQHHFNAWPHNALRHTFASYHYALHQNDALLQAQMGSSSAVLHRHYRALKTRAEARRFWRLRPGRAD